MGAKGQVRGEAQGDDPIGILCHLRAGHPPHGCREHLGAQEIAFSREDESFLGPSFIEHISLHELLRWQELMRDARKKDGTPYSQTYLQGLNNQLEAILNHAVNNYGLKASPMRGVRKMGRKRAGEMRFWAKDEYLAFAEQVEDDPVCYRAFKILYWCGLRVGEMLALTCGGIDFNRGAIMVRRSRPKSAASTSWEIRRRTPQGA